MYERKYVFKVCLKNNSTDPIFDRILVNFRNSKKYVETSLQITFNFVETKIVKMPHGFS